MKKREESASGGLPGAREVARGCAKPEQKSIDVETRVLANWQEFVQHRQEVQLQLQAIHENLQKTASVETICRQRDIKFEQEVARCSARLAQLSQAQESLTINFDKLRGTMENSQAGRDRLTKKVSEMSLAIDGHQREASKVGDGVLREATDAAKRTCRSFAEELLHKMEELNGKLGENMASLEEESTWALQRVQQDVKDLAAKIDNSSFSADAEVRKMEARLESAWRLRIGEVEAQLQQISERALRADRDAGDHTGQLAKLEGRLQECAHQTEVWESALQQVGQRIEYSNTRVEEVQTTTMDQIGRAREDLSTLVHEQQRAFHKALNEHLEDAETHVRQLRADVSSCIDDACSRTDALRETLCNHEASISGLRSAVGAAEQRVEHLTASLETTRDVTQEDWAHAQVILKGEFSHQLKQVTSQLESQLEAKSRDLRMIVEALRLDFANSHSQHQADFGEHSEKFEQLRAQISKALNVEQESRKRAEQADQALKQLRETHDTREQHSRAANMQISQQICEVREEIQRCCRERLDESDKHYYDLIESRTRDVQHDLQSKVDALNLQTSTIADQSRRLCAEACQQSRAWMDETLGEVRERVLRIETAVADLNQADEIIQKDFARHNDSIDRQHAELTAQVREKFRELHERCDVLRSDVLRSTEQEHGIRTDRTSKVCAELAEAKAEHSREIDAARKFAQRQVEETAAQLERRIESAASALSSQCSKSISETRAVAQDAARGAAEKAEKAAFARMEAHCHPIFDDLKKQLTAIRSEAQDRDTQHGTHFAALSHDAGQTQRTLEERLRQHKDSFVEHVADVKASLEDQLRWQQSAWTDQLSEVRDQAADRLRQQLGVQTTKLEESTQALAERMKASMSGLEQHTIEAQQKVDDRISKSVQNLGQELSTLQAQVLSHRDHTKDCQQQSEERLSQVLRVLTQDVTDLKSASRSNDERFSCYQDRLTDTQQKGEERLAKALRSLGEDIAELQTSSHSMNERMENLKRQTVDLQENTAENLSKKLQEQGKDISEFRLLARGLSENWAAYQGQTIDSQQKIENRFAQQVRDVIQQVNELQAWRAAEMKHVQLMEEEATGQKSQQASALKAVEDHLHEKLAKQSEKMMEKVTEVRSSLTDVVRQTREAVHEGNAQVQKICDATNEELARFKDKYESQSHDAKVAQENLEGSLHEVSQLTDRQMQELRQQCSHFSLRCSEIESRVDTLKAEGVAQAKRQSDDTSNTACRLQALDQRILQEKEHRGSALEAQAKNFDKRVDGFAEKFGNALVEHEAQMKRATDSCHCASSKAAEDLRNARHALEEQSKSRHESVLEKQSSIQAQVEKLKAMAVAATTASQHRDEQVNAEFERRSRILQDECGRIEKKAMEELSAVGRALEASEQRIQSQIESTTSSQTAKLQSVQSEIEALRSKHEEFRHSSDSRGIEIMARFDKADESLKDQLQSLTEDADRRSKRQAESLETVKKQMADQVEGVRKKILDVQQGCDTALQQRCTEVSGQAKAALFEASQRLARDASAAATEVRTRLDETVERFGVELREAQASLHTKLHDVQDDFRTQLAAEHQAAQALVTESSRQQDDRIRELQALTERERARSELQSAKQLDETQRGLKREFAETCQKVEAASNAALEREVEQLQRTVEDARRFSQSATKDLAENSERRIREHSESVAKSFGDVSEQLSKLENEHHALHVQVQTKVQGLDDRNAEFREKQLLVEKDLRDVQDEMPAMARRLEGARHAQNTALEELKRATQDRHAQLHRKVQSDAEHLSHLKQQLTTTQEEWKLRHRDAEEALHAAFVEIRKQVQEDVGAVRTELTTVQNLHGDLVQVVRSQREKNGTALAEISQRMDDGFVQSHRRFDEVEAMSSQARVLAILGDHADGMIRAGVGSALQAFQREALDSLEWKLERCVQWLHGANVKLGLNPQGTMFSTDRFRAMLFDDAARPQAPKVAQQVPGAPSTPRSRRRAHSAGPIKVSRQGSTRSP